MIGDLLIIVGIVLLIYGLLLVTKSSVSSQNSGEQQNHAEFSSYENTGGEKSRVSGGGVIMLGPIPIVFGSDKKGAEVAMKLAIVLILLYIVMLAFFR